MLIPEKEGTVKMIALILLSVSQNNLWVEGNSEKLKLKQTKRQQKATFSIIHVDI